MIMKPPPPTLPVSTPTACRSSLTHCSCPDWANPCKHVAATLYGVGARLDTAYETPTISIETSRIRPTT